MTIQDLDKLVQGMYEIEIKKEELIELKIEVNGLLRNCDHFWPDNSPAIENRICKICKRINL